MFDWPSFLDKYSIEYVTSGPNTARGNVSVKCPWCGDDPSHHLGINLSGKGYGCWRSSAHKGKSPYRLIMALINCSYEQARTIVDDSSAGILTSDETFADDMLRRLGSPVTTVHKIDTLELLPEFRRISDDGLCHTLVFPHFIFERKYSALEVLIIADRYGLMHAISGKFAYRIIIPIFMRRQLVTWTGRSFANDPLRYKTLSDDPEKARAQGLPVALMNIKETLFDYDNITKGGNTLVLTEGPFDAMRVNYFGERYGIRSTCVFGKSATPSQLDLLVDVSTRYDRIVSLFDSDAELDNFLVFPDYAKIEDLTLPTGVKDPAELTRDQFNKLFLKD